MFAKRKSLTKGKDSKVLLLSLLCILLTGLCLFTPISAKAAGGIETVSGELMVTSVNSTEISSFVNDEDKGTSTYQCYISTPGQYEFTGSTDEDTVIYVEAEGNVTLTLNNASFGSSHFPAIFTAEGVEKLSIILKGENTLSGEAVTMDDVTHAGTICTTSPLTFSGTGSLVVGGDGITSKASLTMNKGTILVHGDVSAEGDFTINSGTLRADGTLTGKDGVLVTGGTVVAGSSTMSEKSKQKSITLNCTDALTGNVVFAKGDTALLVFGLQDSTMGLTVSSPTLSDAGECEIYMNADLTGDKDLTGIYKNVSSFTGNKLVQGKEAEETFAISNPVNVFENVQDGTKAFSVKDVTLDAIYGYENLTADLDIHLPEGAIITGFTSNSSNFSVSTDESGKNTLSVKDGLAVGKYSGKITVTYQKTGEEEKEAICSVTFAVKKATNEWTENLAMSDWTEYQDKSAPTAKAKFGTVKFYYSDSADGEFTNTVPTEVGEYYVKAMVAETKNYSGLTATVKYSVLAHNHNYEEISASGICSSGRAVTYRCSICKDTYTDRTSPKGHTYTEEVVKAATCTEKGEKKLTCKVCGDSYTEEIPVTGHSYDEGVVTREATCVTNGSRLYTCKVCGETKTEVIAATGSHTYKEAVTKEATCTTEGIKTFTCADCGKSYTETIPATGHSYDGGKVTTQASCSAKGVKTYTCTKCGDSYTEEIAALGGHKYTGIITKEATCEDTGVKTYTCSVCGNSYTQTLKATGHSYNSGVITKQPTCKDAGIKTYTCSRCGKTYSESLKATGHSYDNSTVTKEATCTEDGIRTFTCKNCGGTYMEKIEATGHNYGEGVITVKPTCGTEGTKTYTCANCGEKIEESIPTEGKHTWGEPMTMEDGSTLYVCSVCGTTQTEAPEVIDTDEEEDDETYKDETDKDSEDQKQAAEKQESVRKLKMAVVGIYLAVILIAAAVIAYIFKKQKKGY